MRFNPKLIQDDALFDEDEEFELPGDLVQLAEQLSDDAVYLADRYDPHSKEPIADKRRKVGVASKTPAGKSVGRFAFVSTLASVLLVTMLLLRVSDVPVSNQQNNAEPDSTDVRAEAVAEPGHAMDEATTISAEQPVADDSVEPMPALLMFGASGPEQEAILDWLEQQENSDETLLSI